MGVVLDLAKFGISVDLQGGGNVLVDSLNKCFEKEDFDDGEDIP